MITPIINVNDIEVTEFLSLLDCCVGRVFLVTHEGDKLNLKSRLSQLLGITRLIEGGKITNAQIFCENKEDESKMFRLNLLGKTDKTA